MKDWILFDADNTLFDFTKSAKFSFSKTLEYFGIIEEATHLETYEKVNALCWQQFENKEITAIELRKKRFHLFFKEIGLNHNPLEANSFYLQSLSKTKFLIDGAIELLDKIRALEIKMVIITNGLKEVQRSRIQEANLTHYFHEIVVSDEIGHAKPQSEFFEYTHLKIGNPSKDKMLVVGDSLHSDIKGGNNYGIDTCWYNPREKENNSEIQPHHEVQKLSEILDLIH